MLVSSMPVHESVQTMVHTISKAILFRKPIKHWICAWDLSSNFVQRELNAFKLRKTMIFFQKSSMIMNSVNGAVLIIITYYKEKNLG